MGLDIVSTPPPADDGTLGGEVLLRQDVVAASERPQIVTTAEEVWIQTFLEQFENMSAQTERAYRKEIARLRAWLARYGGDLALGEVKVGEINAYLRFLGSGEALLHPGGRRRPLKKGEPLSDKSVAHARTLLGAFFKYLVKAEYCSGNPVELAVKSKGTRKRQRGAAEFRTVQNPDGALEVEHILRPADMKLVDRAIAALVPPPLVLANAPASIGGAAKDKAQRNRWQRQVTAAEKDHARQMSHYHRCRWIIRLGTLSLLRLFELADLQMCDFQDIDGRWMLYIHAGKGATNATRITVPTDLIEELVIYRRSLGMLPLPFKTEGNPAIMPIYRKTREGSGQGRVIILPGGGRRVEKAPIMGKPLTEGALYSVIKQIFKNAATLAPFQDQKMRLLAASPHWLRHTGITMALNSGESLRDVQLRARHADPQMTGHYDHGR